MLSKTDDELRDCLGCNHTLGIGQGEYCPKCAADIRRYRKYLNPDDDGYYQETAKKIIGAAAR